METRYFEKTGERTPLLGFGYMRLPCLSGDKKEIDTDTAQEMVDRAMQAGVNYFDTAWMYHEGESEPFAGRALEKYPRDSFFLASKMPPWLTEEAGGMDKLFEAQLERCRTDYFDFYLVHSLNDENNESMQKQHMYEYLCEQRRKGKIRHLGFSYHGTPRLLRELLDQHAWEFVQIQLNYLDWYTIDAKQVYEIIAKHGLPVIVMEPVRGGTLAHPGQRVEQMLKEAEPNASCASWALRFAASLPNVMTVLSGMSSVEQLNDNIRTFSDFKPLTQSDYSLLEKAATAFRASGTIPCTGCRYCMDCPAGVDIPRMFGIYNHYRIDHNRIAFENSYCSLEESKWAHNCVSCGVCKTHCPQGIDIPAAMKQVAAFAAEE